jgi:hypothetical protein
MAYSFRFYVLLALLVLSDIIMIAYDIPMEQKLGLQFIIIALMWWGCEYADQDTEREELRSGASHKQSASGAAQCPTHSESY